jgi:hypothetical protein
MRDALFLAENAAHQGKTIEGHLRMENIIRRGNQIGL